MVEEIAYGTCLSQGVRERAKEGGREAARDGWKEGDRKEGHTGMSFECGGGSAKVAFASSFFTVQKLDSIIFGVAEPPTRGEFVAVFCSVLWVTVSVTLVLEWDMVYI